MRAPWTRRLTLRTHLDGCVVAVVRDVDAVLSAVRTGRVEAPVRLLDARALAEAQAVAARLGVRRWGRCGLAVERDVAVRAGARPAIYHPADCLDEVPEAVRWRVVPVDPRGVDWSHEREWRLRGPLRFEAAEVTLVVDGGWERVVREAAPALDAGAALFLTTAR